MRQIDVLLSSKQDATEGQVRTLKGQLQQRERELSSLRVSVQERNTQVSIYLIGGAPVMMFSL